MEDLLIMNVFLLIKTQILRYLGLKLVMVVYMNAMAIQRRENNLLVILNFLWQVSIHSL